MSISGIKKHIRRLRHANAFQPKAEWRQRTRETLLMQISNSMQPVSVSRFSNFRLSVRHGWTSISQVVVGELHGPVRAGAVFASVFAFALAMSAALAQHAVPGDLLFPVKLSIERSRLAIASSDTERLKLKTEFVSSRIQEMQLIAASNVSDKSTRLKMDAEILTDDLNLVRTQLADVSQSAQDQNVADAARLVNTKSVEFASKLTAVTHTLTDTATRQQVAEAQVAAVNTGVRAMQVMINTRTLANAQTSISHDDLIQSINSTVQTVESNISATTQRILLVNATSTANTTATPAPADTPASATSSLSGILNAQQTLNQTKELVQQNKLDAASQTLVETMNEVGRIENAVNALTPHTTSTSPADQPTNQGATSSDSGTSPSSTSTPSASP